MIPSRRLQLWCLLGALFLQAAATLGAVLFLDLPVSTDIDSVEYINSADNVLSRGTLSIESAPPFRPSGFRTPGPLLLNIPLRVLSFRNDTAAVLISRGAVALSALLCALNAGLIGLDALALLAGALLILTPTMFYYSMLPYSTELPYFLVFNALMLGTLLCLGGGNRWGGAMVGATAFYALLLRPAALFVLIAYVGSCAIAAFLSRGALRRSALILAIAGALGTGIAFTGWCARNLLVFDTFRFSTVSADNLLRYNAAGMEPYLDSSARQELHESLKKYRIILQKYGGADQFAVADRENEEGLRLIRKYPSAFLRSHLTGAMESALVFLPGSLGPDRRWLTLPLSAAHLAFLVFGTLGLALLYRSLSEGQRISLLILLVAAVISVLSGGSTHSPRFRIPLDILLALGTASCVARAGLRRRPQAGA